MEFLVIMFFLDFKHTINTNLSRSQKKETVKVKFNFNITTVKQCFQLYGDGYGGHYYTDNQSAADPRRLAHAVDDQNLFKWTARVKLENYSQTSGRTTQYLSIIIVCDSGTLVSNLRIFKKDCCDCSKLVSLAQDATHGWIAKNFCKIDTALASLEFVLEADVNMPYELESLMNMSESVVGLFESGKYTDLILSVQDQKFRCHKAMLMEKSPVFEAMVRIDEKKR
jgi:hypothetical protein